MSKYVIMIWNAADNHMPGAYPDEVELFEGSEEAAEQYGYEKACENYDGYGGLYGLVQEGDDCDSCDGEDPDCPACDGTDSITSDYANQVRESVLHYSVEEYIPEKHNKYFENLSMEIPK